MLARRIFGSRRLFSSSAAASRFVTVDRPGDGRVAVVTLNDPKRLNALNAEMGDEFVDVRGVKDGVLAERDGRERQARGGGRSILLFFKRWSHVAQSEPIH